MKFSNPEIWFSLLPFLVVAIGVFAFQLWAKFKKRGSFSVLSTILRVLVLALLLSAISGPYLESKHESSNVVMLVDVSDSVDEAQSEDLLNRAKQFTTQDLKVDVIPFAREAAQVTLPLSDIGSFHSLKSAWSKLDIGATNLETALSALGTQTGSSVLLVSDGYETLGDSDQAITRLSAGGFRLFPLTPDKISGEGNTFQISNLYAPLVAETQKSVDVRVSIKNSSETPRQGLLEVTHDKRVVLSKQVEVSPGTELLVIAQSDPSQEGIKEITAKLTPLDKSFAPSSQTIFLSGEVGEKILLISGAEEDARFLAPVLSGMSYQVKAIVASSRIEKLPELSDYSTVIFNNVALAQLPASSPRLIKEYTSNGGGFLMLGGNRSFGLGGYLDTAIEEVLPVKLVPPQSVQKRLNIAVQLLLDKSGSMSSDNKMEYAKLAAQEVIKNLKDEDYIGVIGFESAPWILVKMGLVGENRQRALERVERLFGTGRTNLLPAMDEARRGLIRVQAGRKHIIILTDGKLPDEENPFYLDLVKEMRILGITISTVMLGAETDVQMLRQIANMGGGAFYQTTDAAALPRIFLKDVKVKSGEETLKENQEYAVRRGTGQLKSTDIQAFPPLRGYVQTKSKPDANLELVAFGVDKAEPLLASWKFGKGTSIAFTSDANGRWSNYWVNWGSFFNFWRQLIDAARPEQSIKDQKIRFDLRQYFEHGSLFLDLSVFSEQAPREITGNLLKPDGSTQSISFSEISRGHFLAQIDKVTAGKYELRAQAGAQKLTPVALFLSGELFGEKRGQGFNVPRLASLALRTGGKLNPSAEEIRGQVYENIEKTPLGTPFILLALLLLALEIYQREIWRGGWNIFRRSRSKNKKPSQLASKIGRARI